MEPKSASPAVVPREASQQANYAREGPTRNISKFKERHESCQTEEMLARLKNKKKAGHFANNELLQLTASSVFLRYGIR